MNCLEFRRSVITDPKRLQSAAITEDLAQHLRDCNTCAKFAAGITDFECHLEQTLKIDIPTGLESRILLNQQLTQKKRLQPWQALAASMVLGVAVVLGTIQWPEKPELTDIVLKHITDELHHLDDRHNVSLEGLNQVLRQQGLTATGILGQAIHYAGSCQMRRAVGSHLVIDFAGQPVTVLVLPGEFIKARKSLKGKGFQGVIIPIEGGSVAIVGQQQEQVRAVEKEIQSKLPGLFMTIL